MARRIGRAPFTAGLAVLLALAGCTSSDDGDQASAAAPTTSPGVTMSQDLSDRALVDRHPNGAVLTVKGVQVRPNSIALDLSVLNGYINEIRLVDESLFRSRDLYLVDDFGNPYRYDHRGRNPDLRIGAGQELTGSVVFLGRVPDEATSFALKSNVSDPASAVDLSERDRNTDVPSFYVDGIPVP